MPVEVNIADARNTMVISNVDIAMFQWYSVFSILANQHKVDATHPCICQEFLRHTFCEW